MGRGGSPRANQSAKNGVVVVVRGSERPEAG